MKRTVALMLALVLWGMAWFAPAQTAIAEEDPVCVRVGDFSYPLSLAQQSLDSVIKLSDALSDEPLTQEERKQMAGDIIDNLVGVGLIETKLTEAGQHDFTDEEVEQMNAASRSRYEELWQGVYQMMQKNGVDATEDQVIPGRSFTAQRTTSGSRSRSGLPERARSRCCATRKTNT